MNARSFGAGIAIVLVSLPTHGVAEETRTEQLVWECEGRQPSSDYPALGLIHCAGYVSGILDMHAIMADPRLAGGKPQFCLPASGISNDQAIKVFLMWANEHPEDLHKSARFSLMIALREAFPCQ